MLQCVKAMTKAPRPNGSWCSWSLRWAFSFTDECIDKVTLVEVPMTKRYTILIYLQIEGQDDVPKLGFNG